MLRNMLKVGLPLVVAFTALFGLIYLSVQQVYRMSANDPQIQMAEDAAAALTEGQPAQALVPSTSVDLTQSLAPYLIIYDTGGKPLASNALLHGQVPSLPPGVLDYTRQHGEDRISWQPESGVRSAAVIVAAKGGEAGFVLAGRSLREVEKRIDQLTLPFAGAWLVSVIAALVSAALI